MISIRLSTKAATMLEYDSYHVVVCPRCNYENDYFSLSPPECIACHNHLMSVELLLESRYTRMSYHLGHELASELFKND